MSSMYLEQYLDNLENLSTDLTRNFKLIYDLDTKVHDILIEIDKLKAEYLADLKNMDNDTRLTKMKIIDKKYELCKEFSDEKVQLANNTCNYSLLLFFSEKKLKKLDDKKKFLKISLIRRVRIITNIKFSVPKNGFRIKFFGLF